jgi:hypothetical protein
LKVYNRDKKGMIKPTKIKFKNEKQYLLEYDRKKVQFGLPFIFLLLGQKKVNEQL